LDLDTPLSQQNESLRLREINLIAKKFLVEGWKINKEMAAVSVIIGKNVFTTMRL
jgi:hypothetical protein